MECRTGPARPELAEQASQYILLERAVEQEYRPPMRAELQRRVDAVAQAAQTTQPDCPRCGRPMSRKDTRSVSWFARFGKLSAPVSRFVCRSPADPRETVRQAVSVPVAYFGAQGQATFASVFIGLPAHCFSSAATRG
jgi:hypothetical protein